MSYGNGSFPFCVDLVLLYHGTYFYWTLLFEKLGGCLIKNRYCLPFANTCFFLWDPVPNFFCVAFFCLSSFCVLCLAMPACLDYPFFISILFTIYGLVYYLISKCWLRPSALFNRNRISGVIVGVLDSSSVDRVKLKTMKKVFVASPLSTQQNDLVIYI